MSTRRCHRESLRDGVAQLRYAVPTTHPRDRLGAQGRQADLPAGTILVRRRRDARRPREPPPHATRSARIRSEDAELRARASRSCTPGPTQDEGGGVLALESMKCVRYTHAGRPRAADLARIRRILFPPSAARADIGNFSPAGPHSPGRRPPSPQPGVENRRLLPASASKGADPGPLVAEGGILSRPDTSVWAAVRTRALRARRPDSKLRAPGTIVQGT